MTLLTADQFVAGVISVLALRDRRHFVLTDTELDARFEAAFNDLAAREAELGLKLNFTFQVDPLHGDSVLLRDTLLAAKEKELISLNNPTFRTFDVKLGKDRAERYLGKIPVQRGPLEQIVDKHFGDLGQ